MACAKAAAEAAGMSGSAAPTSWSQTRRSAVVAAAAASSTR
ncbi:hypothetical protein [Fodinicola feengrottensis]|nr:hypothetical protein [Fodinicola feengrottensis]